jgi:hypothetical protein
MTGFDSKREMAADKQEPAQEPVECLDCGSHNVGLPANYDSLVDSVKTQPAQEPDSLRDAVFTVLEGFTLPQDVRKILEAAYYTTPPAQKPVARVLQIIKELRPAIKPMEGMGKGKTTDEWFDILVKEIERIQPAQQEAIYGMNQDDWKDVVAAIAKVRDGRGVYLACRPADVFQEWFLALGTAKVKEKNT